VRPGTRPVTYTRLAWLATALTLCGLLGIPARAQTVNKSVLAVYATRRDGSAVVISDPLFQRIIGQGFNGRLDYYSEYLDIAQFSEPDYQRMLRALLRAKYAGRRFDLFLAIGDSALGFLRQYRDDVGLRDAPIVFGVAARPRPLANSAGFITPLKMKLTLDSALALQPDTEHVVVVSGASEADGYYETVAREEFRPLESAVDFTYLTGLPVHELAEKVRALPPHTIIFYSFMTQSANGDNVVPLDVLDQISETANAPVYSWLTSTIGHGAVGGRVFSQDALATHLAELGRRVLRGEKPSGLGVGELDWSVNQFDWRQIRRWGINEARLPPGSEILFRPLSAWEQNRGYLIAGVALMLLQTVFICALLVQRHQRQLAEVALRESEERFRLMADTAPVLVWRANVEKQREFFNEPWLEFTGRTLEQERGDGWTKGVHPDDLDRCLSSYVSAFDARRTFRAEYRLRRSDGEYRWVLDSGVSQFGPNGAFAGYIGSCVDIEDRKLAEEALMESENRLQGLAGRLITAQEDERARIARDLHDDVNQQVAGLAITLSGLARRAAGLPNDQNLALDLSALRERTMDLTRSIRSLSHDLHPAVLKHSGLEAALSSHCREIEADHDLSVVFDSNGKVGEIDPAAALCLYRIAQEALRNAVTHADARRVTVRLARTDDHVAIDVIDDGRGFEMAAARSSTAGLGLVSIRERARLARGVVTITTGRQSGTRVSVRVPISPTAGDQPIDSAN
jgi:PAS domain S-box-containing protein